ncbi:MAG: flagellar basal body rod protein FlgC [Thermoleophilia bacterium]|jgi:flagellar basal-body rod protein FlgC
MSMYSALGISATGMTAERLRMDVVADNLANADSTTGVGAAYRRKAVTMAPATATPEFRLPGGVNATSASGVVGGVSVTGIVEDGSELRRVFEPGHPLADAEGYVTKPNVNPVTEMVDMVAATRAFEANVTAFEASKTMARDALRIIQ